MLIRMKKWNFVNFFSVLCLKSLTCCSFFRDYLMPGTKVGVILPCCHPFIYCSRIDYQCTHISPKSLNTQSPFLWRKDLLYRYIHIYTGICFVEIQSACINSIGCLSQHDLISSVMVTGLVRAFWQSVRN